MVTISVAVWLTPTLQFCLAGGPQTKIVVSTIFVFGRVDWRTEVPNVKNPPKTSSLKDRFCILFFVIVIVIVTVMMHISNVCLLVLSKATINIVENYYSRETVEQNVMFTLYNDEVAKKLLNHCKVWTWVLLNTLSFVKCKCKALK